MGACARAKSRVPVLMLLFAALLFIPISSAVHSCECSTPNLLTCNSEDPCTSNSKCCSGLCNAASGKCVACFSYGGACASGDDCCGGLSCRGGACKGCTCDDKYNCDIPCGSGSECCSGICSTASGKCVACISSGGDCTSASDCCGGLSCTGGKCAPGAAAPASNWYANIYIWIGLAVVMASAFLGLAYMASQLFQLPMLEAWVKIELGELVKSMVIAAFCIALLASVNGAAAFLSGEDSNSQTTVAGSAGSFMRVLYNDGQTLYLKLALIYFNVAKVASFSYSAGLSLGGYASVSYSSSPAAGLSPLLGEIGQAMDTVGNFMLLASAQAAFLRFFTTASTVMLPVGIFLRSFSFTRKVGGTLLAATIAAAVIYPSSILLSREVYLTFADEMKGGNNFADVKVPNAKNPPSADVVCNPDVQKFVRSPIPLVGGETGWWITVCIPVCLIVAAASTVGFAAAFATCFMETCKNVINIVFMILKALFPVLLWLSVFMPFENHLSPTQLIKEFYEPLQQFVLPAVVKFSVLSLVTFIIPIIITLSLLRNLATAFGGEAQLYGLSKLV